MSLATYLKKDIDVFLEDVHEQVKSGSPIREEEFSMFTVEKDYAELTEQAFDSNNTSSIEKMLKELQRQSENTLLEEDVREKVVAVLKEVEDIIIKRVNEVDSTDLHLEAKNILAKRKRESVTKEEREAMYSKHLKVINAFVRERKIDQAKLAYQRLVKDFKTYSTKGAEANIWKNRVLEAYKSIKDGMERVLEEKKVGEEKHKEKVDDIKKKISMVIDGLGRIEPSVLENKLVEIKQEIIAAHLTKDQGEAFLPILRTLVSKINFIKQAKEKERMIAQKKEDAKKEETLRRMEAERIMAEGKVLDEKKSSSAPRISQGSIDFELSEAEKEEVLYKRAIILEEKGEYAQAEKILKSIIARDPQNFRADVRLREIGRKRLTRL